MCLPASRTVLTLALMLTCCWASGEPNDEGSSAQPESPENSWLDDSRSYLDSQTQALAGWMDEFFGDESVDDEAASSFLRLQIIEDWDSDDGSELKVRVRGSLHLPRISQRLSIVFQGEETEPFSGEGVDDNTRDSIGLQYLARETVQSRWDYTLGWASGRPRPGIRYRRQNDLGEKLSYRLTERIQYEHGENFYSRTQFRLSRLLDNDSIVHWSNNILYGERTQGVEWSTRLQYLTRYRDNHPRPIGLVYFAGISGITRPEPFVDNYNVGFLFRRQFYRDYLFLELEPSMNYRKREHDDDRDLVWQAVLRLEIALNRPKEKDSE